MRKIRNATRLTKMVIAGVARDFCFEPAGC